MDCRCCQSIACTATAAAISWCQLAQQSRKLPVNYFILPLIHNVVCSECSAYLTLIVGWEVTQTWWWLLAQHLLIQQTTICFHPFHHRYKIEFALLYLKSILTFITFKYQETFYTSPPITSTPFDNNNPYSDYFEQNEANETSRHCTYKL